MHAGHKALAAALILLSAFAAQAHTHDGRDAAQEPAAQTEPPRRPQGPAASPVIKLPRDASLGDEREPQQQQHATRDERAAEPRKWEYCSISGFVFRASGFGSSASRIASAVVLYFGGGMEKIEGPSDFEDDALAVAFAKLGEDGWELAGTRTDFHLSDGNGKSTTVYFFKRPKRRD
ncbi:MAG TPA: hypothetical protein VNZ44_14435 [Pyrinomonadaceae bacterium]|nr:hypothetical protein [Pyrinomonadaceae bacterium]